jgi:hypothetical protein
MMISIAERFWWTAMDEWLRAFAAASAASVGLSIEAEKAVRELGLPLVPPAPVSGGEVL